MWLWPILGAIAAVGGSASVQAAEKRVDWPTYFRAGPSMQYTVLDELLRGTLLDVRSCDGAWCQVVYGPRLGYVPRAALDAGDGPSSGAAPGTDCFESRRAGYGSGERLTYCRR